MDCLFLGCKIFQDPAQNFIGSCDIIMSHCNKLQNLEVTLPVRLGCMSSPGTFFLGSKTETSLKRSEKGGSRT